jgi:hypothetical protein
MKRMDVELLLALQLDEPHRRPGRSLRKCLGVPVIILLRLDVGTYILRRHELDGVTLRQKPAPDVMGPQHASIATVRGACFPANSMMLAGRMRRRSTTAPRSSNAATLQLFLPISMPIITMVMVRPP